MYDPYEGFRRFGQGLGLFLARRREERILRDFLNQFMQLQALAQEPVQSIQVSRATGAVPPIDAMSLAGLGREGAPPLSPLPLPEPQGPVETVGISMPDPLEIVRRMIDISPRLTAQSLGAVTGLVQEISTAQRLSQAKDAILQNAQALLPPESYEQLRVLMDVNPRVGLEMLTRAYDRFTSQFVDELGAGRGKHAFETSPEGKELFQIELDRAKQLKQLTAEVARAAKDTEAHIDPKVLRFFEQSLTHISKRISDLEEERTELLADVDIISAQKPTTLPSGHLITQYDIYLAGKARQDMEKFLEQRNIPTSVDNVKAVLKLSEELDKTLRQQPQFAHKLARFAGVENKLEFYRKLGQEYAAGMSEVYEAVGLPLPAVGLEPFVEGADIIARAPEQIGISATLGKRLEEAEQKTFTAALKRAAENVFKALSKFGTALKQDISALGRGTVSTFEDVAQELEGTLLNIPYPVDEDRAVEQLQQLIGRKLTEQEETQFRTRIRKLNARFTR